MKTVPFILLVEDDEDERFLAVRALQKEGLTNIVHLWDGLSAKSFFEERLGKEAKSPLPDVVLMDLKMPGITGHEVLEWMAKQPELGGIRRYVLSSSGNPEDRERAAKSDLSGYFVKPLKTDFINLIKFDFPSKD